MLIDTIRTLVDLYHRDKELAQSTIQINEEILHPQERLRKERSVDDDYDEDDDVDSDDEIKMLDMESAAKQAVKEMTEDDKALLALFQEYRRTRRSAHGATGMIDFHSGPSEDQMAGEGDQEALEYLQACVGVQEEQARLRSEDEEYEDSAGGDTQGEADDGQTKGNENTFLQQEDA